jgi:hypothetical protein
MADLTFVVVTIVFFAISWWYVVGAIVFRRKYGTGIFSRSDASFLIMGYLIYALLYPGKF